MAAPNAQMGLLGSFYDAIFGFSKEQGKKYGSAAAPDLIGAPIVSDLGSGIAEVAATVSSFNAIANEVTSSVNKYVFGKMGGGLTIPDVLGEGRHDDGKYGRRYNFAKTDYLEDGSTYGGDVEYEIKPANIDLNLSNLGTFISNPRSFAQKLASGVWEARIAERNLKMLAGAGNAAQEAANYYALRNMDVANDIAATVVHARKYSLKDANVNTPLQEGVVSNSMGMFAGIRNQKEREEFAAFFNSNLQNDSVAAYKAYLAANPGALAASGLRAADLGKIKAFNDIFGDGNILGKTQAQLFAGGLGHGDFIANAMSSAAAANAGNVALSASLRRNLLKFQAEVTDPNKAFGFVQGYSASKLTGFSNMTPLVQQGLRGMEREYTAIGNNYAAQQMRGAAALTGKMDGKMSLGDNLAYLYNRWNTMPAMNKWLSWGGLITGDSFVNVMNGTGGLFGRQLVDTKINGGWFSGQFRKGGVAVDTNLWTGRSRPLTEIRGFGLEDELRPRGTPEQAKNRIIDWAHAKGVVRHDANAMQKLAYSAYVFHPWQFVSGLLNGRTMEHLAWLGSGYGKNRDYENMSKRGFLGTRLFSGQWAVDMMNNKTYKGFVRGWQTLQYGLNIPQYLAADAAEWLRRKTWDKIKKKIWDEGLKLAARKIAVQLVGEAVLAWATGFISEVVIWTYRILNIVTFGLVDTVIGKGIQLLFELIIGILLGLIAYSAGLFFMVTDIIGGNTTPAHVASLLGTGGAFAPNPNYSPIISKMEDPFGPEVPPGKIPKPPPIDWSKYKNFSNNACPIQDTAGGSITGTCTEGPNGQYSHHGHICPGGSPCDYAIDLAPGNSPTEVVAPEDGKVSTFGLSCSTGGTVVGIKFAADSGVEYRFLHVVISPNVTSGQHVTKGTLLAAMLIGQSPCSTGSHVHFEVWRGGANDPYPDAAYELMCQIPTGGLHCPAN